MELVKSGSIYSVDYNDLLAFTLEKGQRGKRSLLSMASQKWFRDVNYSANNNCKILARFFDLAIKIIFNIILNILMVFN
jgi:hypothetical protein